MKYSTIVIGRRNIVIRMIVECVVNRVLPTRPPQGYKVALIFFFFFFLFNILCYIDSPLPNKKGRRRRQLLVVQSDSSDEKLTCIVDIDKNVM